MTRALSWFFSFVALGAVTLLVGVFVWQSLPVWHHEGWHYITGTKWFFRQKEFGTLPMIYGTVIVALIALVLAAPLGFGAAIFTAEYLPRRVRLAVKVLIELLAGVPSVVYGLLGILLLRDWIYNLFEKFEPLSGDTLLTAGVLLAVMILPTIVTLSDDALRGVSSAQRRAARGLGLTHAETVLSIALPQAKRGLGAALLLALGRALGETIAVFLVVGRQDNNLPEHVFSLRAWLDAGQTITSKLGGSETNIAYGDHVHWGAMVGLALLLLIMTGTVTLLGTGFGKRSDA
ncbi:phosphate ABC transporter, inner membrane subunit PstC [Chthoniobacter flavus Ellin428]|uniref:Phosphate transport system permease protein n=1 Tax=Chthoniobacter flavus Ellin428 TaxID=497964 RepID=B4D5S9_9BACT|nr:phosphate ABC transporter permease subunit PstC [Chthoniobacter flavus]EDY18132.1 phosphate ABC transporter, inner membrane subunit PstC [Chthoniobacter flavus Ellin428]TCO91511.1 phosphate ABC transporter membrane protein 1 (PhoT family) [Chthoniobacter flavus]